MKKAFVFALLLFISAIPSLSANAMESTVTISIDGVAVNFPDAKPFVDESNRIQVPVRAIAEALGKKVNWLADIETVIISADGGLEDDSISLVIGSNEMRKNQEIIIMDTSATIKDTRTFVPVRYVAESFGYAVEWNSSIKHVELVKIPQMDVDLAQNSFDLSLLESMPKDRNYMISPYSLKMALAMAANGANGDTKREILDALEIANLEQFNATVKDFIENSNGSESVLFNIANSIWHNTDYYSDEALDFSETYKNIITDYFLGAAEKINNANGAETINNWISAETMDKIKNVINDDLVEGSLSFLVNTIYFKGDWAVPFNAESTRDNTFTDRNGEQKTTAFMNNTGNYNYYENDDFRMLAKPYKNDSVKMYLLLPNTDRAITQDEFENAIENMTIENTNLSLPKFKTEYLHSNLVDILTARGIQTAFNPHKADFLNMYSKQPIENVYIGLILQKTFIEVDEKGTEAAAATVLSMQTTGMPLRTVDFKCDKPFTYFIRDDSTGDILFMGEYAFVE